MATASRVQESFRRIYLDLDSGAGRMKTTKDEEWIKRHGADQVDMATLDYQELPLDWQIERRIGAQIALDAVIDAMRDGQTLDDSFIEKVSAILHDKWLERNRDRVTEIEKSLYGDLPENEKEKDRFFAHAAVEVYRLIRPTYLKSALEKSSKKPYTA